MFKVGDRVVSLVATCEVDTIVSAGSFATVVGYDEDSDNPITVELDIPTNESSIGKFWAFKENEIVLAIE